MSTTYINLINKSHSQLHVPILRLFVNKQHQRKTAARLQRLTVINQRINSLFIELDFSNTHHGTSLFFGIR